jgi:predicted ester cyclase
MFAHRFASIVLFTGLTACASSGATSTETRSSAMDEIRDSKEKRNAAVVRSVYEQCLNEGRMELLDDIVDPELTTPDGAKGPAAFRRALESLRLAFPDIHYVIEDVLADRDRVAIRWTWTGTHRGPFRSIAPTEKRVSSGGFAIFELREGKISRSWLETDRLGFLDAIGVLPSEIGALLRPGPPASPSAQHSRMARGTRWASDAKRARGTA